jgi:hypothetical protein
MSIGRGLTALSRKRAQAATVLMQRRMQRNATMGRRELHCPVSARSGGEISVVKQAAGTGQIKAVDRNAWIARVLSASTVTWLWLSGRARLTDANRATRQLRTAFCSLGTVVARYTFHSATRGEFDDLRSARQSN